MKAESDGEHCYNKMNRWEASWIESTKEFNNAWQKHFIIARKLHQCKQKLLKTIVFDNEWLDDKNLAMKYS